MSRANLPAAELREIAAKALADIERMRSAPANAHEADPNYQLGAAQAYLQRIAVGNDARWVDQIHAAVSRVAS